MQALAQHRWRRRALREHACDATCAGCESDGGSRGDAAVVPSDVPGVPPEPEGSAAAGLVTPAADSGAWGQQPRQWWCRGGVRPGRHGGGVRDVGGGWRSRRAYGGGSSAARRAAQGPPLVRSVVLRVGMLCACFGQTCGHAVYAVSRAKQVQSQGVVTSVASVSVVTSVRRRTACGGRRLLHGFMDLPQKLAHAWVAPDAWRKVWGVVPVPGGRPCASMHACVYDNSSFTLTLTPPATGPLLHARQHTPDCHACRCTAAGQLGWLLKSVRR